MREDKWVSQPPFSVFFHGLQVLNMPPTSLLDAGRNTKRYFRKDPTPCWFSLELLGVDATTPVRAALWKCRRSPSWSQERVSHSPVRFFLVYLVFCDGGCWMKPLKIGVPKIERNFLKLQSPMSLKCLFKRLPFQMCVWRKGPFVTERVTCSFTHQCEAAGMFTDWTSCSPLFFWPCAHILFVFQGGEGGKILHQTDQIINTFMLQEELKLPEGAEGASWRVKLHWTSW